MKSRVLATALMALFLSSAALHAFAADAASVPEKKRTTLGLYLESEEVLGFLSAAQGKTLFLDVRTPAELAFVGMTSMVDANVPLLIGPSAAFDAAKGMFKLTPNPDFVAAAERRLAGKGLTKNDAVVVMCRSGDRSAIAANTLAKAGFSHVWSVVDGFEGDPVKDGPEAGHRIVNGWKNKGLPWGYSLDKAKMYQVGE